MVWNKFEQSLTSGINAGISTWRGANQMPLYVESANWDAWETRLRRYQQYEFYYNNAQYDDINLYIKTLKENGRLYINTRSVYNPVNRLVNLYADKVYPASLDMNNLERGAIPVVAGQTLRDSLKRLFRQSNWNTEMRLFVRTGEKYADVFLRVVDDTESRRTVLEVVSPHKVRFARKDSAGNIKEIWFEYNVSVEREALKPDRPLVVKSVRVTEVITTDKVTIYEDGVEVDSWDNPFGFVPVVHVKAYDENAMFGAPRWHGSRSKIDEINSQASLLNDQVRKAIIPYIATIGGQLKPNALRRSEKTMDEIINIAVGVGGDVKAIAPNIDIASTMNNIHSQLDELREDLPELFLYQLTDMTVPPSGVALRQFFDLAVNRINAAQGVYDDAFIRACQMACTISGVQGYEGFPFDLNSFDAGELEFFIKQRDVIYDAIPETTRINYLISSGAPRSAVWAALGVSKEDQEDWEARLEAGEPAASARAGGTALENVLEANSATPRTGEPEQENT